MPRTMTPKRKKPWVITLVVVAAVIAGRWWPVPGATWVFGLSYLVWCAWLCGRWVAPNIPLQWKLLYGTTCHLALMTIIGSLVYWAYRLDTIGLNTVLGLTPFVWLVTPPPARTVAPDELWHRDPLRGLRRSVGVTTLLVAGFFLLEAYVIMVAIRSATTEAIRTPWQVLPQGFWVAYLLATLAVLALNLRTDRAGRRLPLILVHLGVSASIALIVYPIGFGFDSFIHQAAERVIAANGVIAPKTPYYIGQYALVVLLSRIFGLAVVAIDRIAAPAFFVLIAALTYHPWRRIAAAAAVPVILLLLPYHSFIATTPQGLANGWVLITALAVGVPQAAAAGTLAVRWRVLAALAAAAAAVTHPIAGVAAGFLLVFGLMVRAAPDRAVGRIWRRLATSAIWVASVLALPLLFIWQARRSGFLISQVWQPQNFPRQLGPALRSLLPELPNRAAPLLDFAYGIELSRLALIAGLAAVGAAIFRRRSLTFAPILLTSTGLLASFLVLDSSMVFPQLIANEQSFFPQRALELAELVTLPLAAAGSALLLHRANRSPALRLALVALGAAGATATLYLAYPRVDRYHVDRGYNVTAADIEAVHVVRNDADGNYLVLANQMTSAAAIREFGFSPTYPAAAGGRPTYAYPIPTGEPLYQQYLDMVYDAPRRDVAQRAAGLVATEINAVYFILSRYWDNFDTIVAEAEQHADRQWSVANGKIIVFRYDLD